MAFYITKNLQKLLDSFVKDSKIQTNHDNDNTIFLNQF